MTFKAMHMSVMMHIASSGMRRRNSSVSCSSVCVIQGGIGSGQLEALWSIVMEAEMFTSSHERKALGLQLFSLLLPYLRYVTC